RNRSAPRPGVVQPRLPAAGARRARRRAARVRPCDRARRQARPRLVRQGAVADQARPRRGGDRAAQEEHRVAAAVAVRLLPAGARVEPPGQAAERDRDDSPAVAVRAEGRQATRARDRRRCRHSGSVRVGRGRNGQQRGKGSGHEVEYTSHEESGDEARRVLSGGGAMQLSAKHHEYWSRNLRTTVVLLAIWFVVTYVIGYFARSLDFNFFGWPFYFWVAAQGALVVYVVLIGYYARYMNRLDREYGVEEEEEA